MKFAARKNKPEMKTENHETSKLLAPSFERNMVSGTLAFKNSEKFPIINENKNAPMPSVSWTFQEFYREFL